ncbi:MAG TPA: hypothetical protein VIK27_10645 [Candidatus Aquilonibacter sp.]
MNGLAALLALHVLAAAFWIGSTLMLTLFVVPAALRAGIDVPSFMQALFFGARLQLGFALVGATTVVTGMAALWIVSGGFGPTFMQSETGTLISLGAASGILAIVTGIVTRRLQEKGAPFAYATGALLVVALLSMVYGSHV